MAGKTRPAKPGSDTGKRMLAEAKKKIGKLDLDNLEPIEVRPARAPDIADQVVLFIVIEPVVDEDTGEAVLDPETDEPMETRTEYRVPRRVPFQLSLQAIEVGVTQGQQALVIWTLRQLLGDDGYDALVYRSGIEEDDFERIVEIATAVMIGNVEGKAA